MSRAGWLGFVFAVLMAGSGVSALAQDNVMKICGDKWRVAKESSATSGQTWMQFLAKCRTETAAIVAPAAPSKPVASIAETPAPASEKPAVATAPGIRQIRLGACLNHLGQCARGGVLACKQRHASSQSRALQ